MATFKSIDSMLASLQNAIDNSLLNEVANEVRKVEQRAIDEVVYDSYSPKVYDRRDMSGGLIANENIIASLESTGVLEIDNITPLNSKYPLGWSEPHPAATRAGFDSAAEAVISGRGYDFPRGDYTRPRDFIQKTKEELNSGSIVSDALKQGLKRNGFNAQ